VGAGRRRCERGEAFSRDAGSVSPDAVATSGVSARGDLITCRAENRGTRVALKLPLIGVIGVRGRGTCGTREGAEGTRLLTRDVLTGNYRRAALFARCPREVPLPVAMAAAGKSATLRPMPLVLMGLNSKTLARSERSAITARGNKRFARPSGKLIL